jgi:hypothetical protein
MEGRQEEYLANRVPRPIAHIAEVEENLTDVEEVTIIPDDTSLNNEFAAMSFTVSQPQMIFFFPLMLYHLSLRYYLKNPLP